MSDPRCFSLGSRLVLGVSAGRGHSISCSLFAAGVRSSSFGVSMYRVIAVMAIWFCLSPLTFANGCIWSHIDQHVDRNESGIWNPPAYRGVLYGLSAADLGGALWEGDESQFGRTLWQAFDSELLSGIGAAVGKYAFSRVRPSEG